MARTGDDIEIKVADDETIQLRTFQIEGLFGYLSHQIQFPSLDLRTPKPEMLILEGQNGTGKTTIMEMISGIVNGLVFDPFRKVPFVRAKLTLTNGLSIGVEHTGDSDFPLSVTFGRHSVLLASDRSSAAYSETQAKDIERFRAAALPYLNVIDFELLTIERTLQLIGQLPDEEDERLYTYRRHEREYSKHPTKNYLAKKVRAFLREAQVNHRKFFETSHLNLLPQLINRLSAPKKKLNRRTLLGKVNELIKENRRLSSLGLHADDAELRTLRTYLRDDKSNATEDGLQVFETYIKLSESQIERLSILASRIEAFEEILAEFLVGKRVKVSPRVGLQIESASGGLLDERELSSGEYHFLYMMVSALLCQRLGTVLAIDEPELSLHVSWQRRLVSALTRCASGASPIFFFATHSTAISASHSYAVTSLSPIE